MNSSFLWILTSWSCQTRMGVFTKYYIKNSPWHELSSQQIAPIMEKPAVLFACCTKTFHFGEILFSGQLQPSECSISWWIMILYGFLSKPEQIYWLIFRARNSLIGFLSESLVFCEKNERMYYYLLKKREICSFALFGWATLATRSWSLIFGERPERFAQIAYFWWATWVTRSHRSEEMIRSFFNKIFCLHCI